METTDIAVISAENDGASDIPQTPSEPADAPRDLEAEFEELIRGEFKDAFAARVKGILLKRFRERERREPAAARPEAELAAESEEVTRDYPSFDLEKERADPLFARLVEAGVDLRTAYEVTHRDSVFPVALRAALEEQTALIMQERGSAAQRISEGSRAAAVASPRLSADTRSAREALERRAMKGERIIL